ncbi:uncharacterized protein [Fopius arisanus]|uniref:Uncharacterized protein isoform X2 n=1 Tax=Fopius arisanus TaxID=64838 RepID=A0A9R1U9F5_9HYME|nr:PREDICTED: uncharacterized protein LOC105272106 isoform X2 [Fopius arisanus]
MKVIMNGQRINRLKGQIVELKNEIVNIRNAPRRSQMDDGFKIDSEGDEVRDGFKLPCKNLEELKIFDRQLQEDQAFRKKICLKIYRDVDKERSISRNLGEIIRKLITQNVAVQITPLKKTEGKEVFKELTLYACLVAVFGHKYGSKKEPLDYKKFNKALGGVLNNSKDWNGGRRQRGKRAMPQNDNNPKPNDEFFEGIFQEE